MYIRILAIAILSSTAWAQHSGHEQTQTQSESVGQIQQGAIIRVKDAIKVSQRLFRDMEKAVHSKDEAAFDNLAFRYESSIEQLMESVDSVQNDNSTLKDLELAQRSLSHQLQQIRRLADTAPPAFSERFAAVEDGVILARDNILAQQQALRATSANSGGDHQGGKSHGCGSRH